MSWRFHDWSRHQWPLTVAILELLINVAGVFVAIYFGMKTLVQPKITGLEKGLTTVEERVNECLPRLGVYARIVEAEGYVQGGNSDGKAKALRIYQEVEAGLPDDLRGSLNKDLLAEARTDCRNGHFDDALRKYRALFSDWLSTPGM